MDEWIDSLFRMLRDVERNQLTTSHRALGHVTGYEVTMGKGFVLV